MTTKTVKLKTPAVFKIEHQSLIVKVLNNDTKQYEVYKIFEARNYKTLDAAISDIYQFIADHSYKWHFNGLDYVTVFFHSVRSYIGNCGNKRR